MKSLSKGLLTALAAAALLAACGGSDDDKNPPGALLETPTAVATVTAAQIDAGTTQSGLIALSGAAKCDVRVIGINYATRGPADEDSNSSGVVLLPVSSATCTPNGALIAYARGTEVYKPRALANPTDGETSLLIAMYASQGYAVVATDYLGYAKSTFGYHPYLHADSEATTVLDSVRAARNVASQQSYTLSGKLMISGYSQGGHSSMAAHRAAERDYGTEFNVVAGAHLAGPYNMAGSFRAPGVIAGYQYFVPLIVNSYQRVYGNVYTDINTVYKAPYAANMATLLPSPTLTYTTLITTGALPGGTPTQARDALFQSAYITDVSTNNNNGLYVDAGKNTLFGWSPKSTSRVLLCGGAGDPTVLKAVHQDLMKADFDSRALTNVSSIDVDPQIQATYGPGGVAPTDPTSAAFATYYGSYHGTYEPPFCTAAARQLFDAVK